MVTSQRRLWDIRWSSPLQPHALHFTAMLRCSVNLKTCSTPSGTGKWLSSINTSFVSEEGALKELEANPTACFLCEPCGDHYLAWQRERVEPGEAARGEGRGGGRDELAEKEAGGEVSDFGDVAVLRRAGRERSGCRCAARERNARASG